MSRTRRDDIARLAQTAPTASLRRGLDVSREALARATPGTNAEAFDLDCIEAVTEELARRATGRSR